MRSQSSFERLVRLFEQELRASEVRLDHDADHGRRRRRVSQELEVQVTQFVAEERQEGRTPEQMLVELKAILSRAAPEVPGSRRNDLLASVTGRAIHAFFEPQRKQSPSD